MSWKIGTKLVCLKTVKPLHADIYTGGLRLPKKNEIVTFDGVYGSYFGATLIYLKEYNQSTDREAFDIVWFRPLLGESAKSELLASFTEVTETSDLPIRVPQTENV